MDASFNGSEDPRFDSSVDRLTGYRTSSVLCMPVCNYEGSVIGVAEIINKKDGNKEFTPNDVEVFRRYLTFCGIGIQNAQLFDISMQEYKRNQLLLQLARGLFEEQTSLDRLITKIMTEARDLLKCEKCAVYLIEKVEGDEKGSAGSSSPVLAISSSRDMEKDGDVETIEDVEETSIGNVSCLPAPEKVLSKEMKLQPGLQMAFELHPSEGRFIIERRLPAQLTSSALARLACYVADTGRTLNISDVEEWLGTSLEDAGHPIYSVLTIPVYNASKQILGVAQMINKENGLPFNEYDISTFEAFAIFSGLGIQNTQVYEKACRLMARQKVALECLSYHATATQEDTDRLGSASIPEADSMQLYSFDFSDLCLTDDETCMCVIRMFKEFNFLEIFRIPHEVLCRYILSVKKNYRPVKYHNWRHALTVAQTMFAMLKTGKMELFMTELEMLGLLVACLSHDLDHRGTNNSFQTKTDSPLALLYSTSTMEHHHFDQCVMILSQDSNNIFQMLSADEYRRVMRVVEKAILSTDMAMYFKKKHKFIELSDNGEFDWQCQEKKELLCGMMMTACDLSAIAKPWEVQHKVAKLVADEFFEQGDLEKLKLNEQPMAIMDRDKKDELPKMQVGFINAICLPLYKSLSESFPWVKPLYDGCERNREQWELLAEQVEMGLTWIDHETIENPVERNAREVVSKITLNPKTLPASAASPLRNVESRRSFAASSERGAGGKFRGWLLSLL